MKWGVNMAEVHSWTYNQINHSVLKREEFQGVKRVSQLLAFHCSPVIMGINTANTITIKKEDLEMILKLLVGTEVRTLLLYQNKEKCILFIYREHLLKKHLQGMEEWELLKEYGYQKSNTLEQLLYQLIKRFHEYVQGEKSFPHELGAFLGYPMEDIRGFIDNQGRNSKYTGYWKVYGDVQYAKEIFFRYDCARRMIIRGIFNGKGFHEVYKEKMQCE